MILHVRRAYQEGQPPEAKPYHLVFQLEVFPEEARWLDEYGDAWQQQWQGSVKSLRAMIGGEVWEGYADVRAAQQREQDLLDACRDFLDYCQEAFNFPGENAYPIELPG